MDLSEILKLPLVKLALVQGTDIWLEETSKYHRSSNAAAMMGDDPRMSRSTLVRLLATGEKREFNEWVQSNLLDNGHKLEAAARALVEEDTEDDLFQWTFARGKYLASLDGTPFGNPWIFEHKAFNKELVAAIHAEKLPMYIVWQLEHQLLVVPADHVLLVCSDGTRANRVQYEYRSSPELRERLVAGWELFEKDIAAYKANPVIEHTQVIAAPVHVLPAVAIAVEIKDGKLAVTHGLEAFKFKLQQVIEALPKDPETDTDFEICKAGVKTLADAEAKIKSAVDSAIAQMTQLEEAKTLASNLVAISARARIDTDKKVENNKATVKNRFRTQGTAAWDEFVKGHSEFIGHNLTKHLKAPDFEAGMKNRSTVKGQMEGANNALVKAKLDADTAIKASIINAAYFKALPDTSKALIPDVGNLICTHPDAFVAIVEKRVADHEKAVAAEAEAARVKAEAVVQENLRKAAEAPIVQAVAAELTTLKMEAAPLLDGGFITPVLKHVPVGTAAPKVLASVEGHSCDELRKKIVHEAEQMGIHELRKTLEFMHSLTVPF